MADVKEKRRLTVPQDQTYVDKRNQLAQIQPRISGTGDDIVRQLEVDYPSPSYAKSPEQIALEDVLADVEAKKPGEYNSAYSPQIQSVLDQIINRKEFNYNFNADPLYQQYKSQYQQQGKQAMIDAAGQAAALTGGYGNSYASTAGNQAYQGYLGQLNNVIPELYDAAYGRYQNEGNEQYNRLGALQGLEQTEYGKYRDTVGDYNNDRGYYYGKVGDMGNSEFARYQTDLNRWMTDREFNYNKGQADRDFNFNKEQADRAQANWEAEYKLKKKVGSGKKAGNKYSYLDLLKMADNHTLTYDVIAENQMISDFAKDMLGEIVDLNRDRSSHNREIGIE